MVGLSNGEKTEDMCNRLDTICDRQMDGQTSCHGIVRAMHMRCAVKINVKLFLLSFVVYKTVIL